MVEQDNIGINTLKMSKERRGQIALAFIKQILIREMNGTASGLKLADYANDAGMMCFDWQNPNLGLTQPEALEFLDDIRQSIRPSSTRQVHAANRRVDMMFPNRDRHSTDPMSNGPRA